MNSTDQLADGLTEALGRGRPFLAFGSGAAGSATMRAALDASAGIRTLYMPAPDLPDSYARCFLENRLLEITGLAPGNDGRPASWPELLRQLRAVAPVVLILEGVGSLFDANRRLSGELGEFWHRLGKEPAPIGLILIDEDRSLIHRLRGPESPFEDPRAILLGDRAAAPGLHFEADPLPYGVWARRLDGWSADEVIRTYCVFGGLAPAIEAFDPGVRFSTNVRRLLLSIDGPLFDLPLRRLRERFQSPARYGAILRALSRGARDWRSIARFDGGSGASGSIAPYLSRLQDLGIVEATRSLDAKPNARRRRYRTADPFEAFWWAVMPELRAGLRSGRVSADVAWSRIRAEVDTHVQRELPRILEQYLLHEGGGRLGAQAREVGGLWGEDHDIAVGATLKNGAVVYGMQRWSGQPPVGEGDLEHLEGQMRRTRYGYGRQGRVRLLLSHSGFTKGLTQRSRRDPLVRYLTPVELIDDARSARETPTLSG